MNEYDTLLNTAARPAANTNEYDAFLQDDAKRQQEATRASIYSATQTQPDAYAKAMGLAKKSGLPAETVERNMPTVEREVKLNEYDALLKASPKTAEAVRDPDTAKLAHDDLGILSTIEGGFLSYYDLLRAAPGGFVKGAGSALSGIGELNDVAARGIVRGIEGAGLDGFGDFLADVEIPWWLSPSEILKRPGQQTKALGTAIDVPAERQNLGTDITGGVGQMASQIAAAIVGGPLATAATLIGQGADQMAERVEKAGKVGTPEGDAAIVIGASVTALTEKVGLDAMLERVPPQIKNAILRRITDVALAGGIEAAQEVVEGVLQNLTEQALVNPDAEIFQGLEREALAAGGAGALTRGLLMAIIPGRQVIRQQQNDETAAQRATQGIEALDGLVEQAGQSKLLGRDRERFEAFVTANAGEDAAVYIPAEKLNEYFQALDAPFELMDDWGIGDQLAQATARGGDVAVPMSKYLATAAEHHAALRGDLRLGIGEYTLNEAEEFNARKEEILRERFEEARAAVEDERLYAEPQERIQEDVRSQLVAAGRSLDVAEQEATVVAAFFGTMGKRAGVDPMELYQQSGLQIRGVLPESLRDKPIDLLDPIIDRVRSGKEKTDKQIFGDSLLEWIANRGGITDPGGDLTAMDAGSWHRGAKFRRKLLRDIGADTGQALPGVGGVDGSLANFDPDEVALAAWEAGFFPEFTERPTTDVLFNAIREELAGRPRFNDRRVDTQALAERQGVADLAETLERLGIDINKATNEEVKAALRAMGDQQRAPGGAEFDQPAYHGTPHAFDRFSLDAIGTGEGAQAYGWGLYFAGRREVAEAYRKALAGHTYKGILGRRVPFDINRDLKSPSARVAMRLADSDVTVAIAEVEAIRERPGNTGGLSAIDADLKLLRKIQKAGGIQKKGRLYTVDIPEDGEYLLWDKPLSEQPDAAVVAGGKALEAALDQGGPILDSVFEAFENGSMTGEQLYRVLAGNLGSDRAASEALAAAGIPGIKYLDGSSRAAGEGAYNYVIFDENLIKVIEYEQRKSDTKRGSIQFGSGETIINLFEKADLSTFLHETGHLFLDVFGKLADSPDAPQQIRDDYRAVLDWMGVKSTADVGTDQHEQFARGFEAYLYEGKAPSVGLQGVFARFRSWLVNIYRSISRLNVNVSPEVKAVMDRMLATEEEIAAAETGNAFAPLFKEAADAGMTDKEFEDYQRTGERATQAAEERLLKRAMAEIKRERLAWWNEEKAKVREEVEREVNGRPVYQALHWLRTGDVLDSPETKIPHRRLSKAALVASYGEDITKYLPKGIPPIWTDKGGVSAEEVADLFGLSSGDELVQQLMKVQPRRKVIDTETQVRMLSKHGDLLNDGSIEEEARAATHGDERALFLHTELRALSKRGDTADPTPRSEAKRLAAQIIAREPVRRAQPGRLAQAEVRAGKAAERALAAGDIAEATKQKRRQLLNHYLFMEARKAQEEVEDGVRYLTRFTKKRTIPSIEQGYLDQIKGILERYSLDRASLRAIDKRTSLAAWVAEQEAQGMQVNVPDKLLNEATRMHYRNMPVEDFRGLVDTIRNIHHLGRLKQRLLDAKEKRDFQAVVDDLTSTILDNNDVRTEGTTYSPTLAGQARDVVERIHAEHVKPEFLFRRLDGYKDEGPVWQRLFKPIADAEAAEQVKMREMVEGMEHAFRRYTRKERARWLTKRTFIPETGKSFTKAEMLSIALNWGNEQNRAALLEGLDWNAAQAEAVLAKLDARDWETVQDVWALVDTLWPDIAALQKDLTGVVPEKVEPAPFERRLADGTVIQLPGGYYPLKYDPSRSHAAFQRAEKANSADLFESNWMRPATKQGHTKERVGSGGQAVRLELSVLPEHITNVVHDITHRRAIMDIDRLIQNKRVREAIETTAGKQMYRQIRPWLQAIAADQRQPAAFMEKLIGRARMGATVVNMGWKVTTAIVQPLGILQTVERVGFKAATKHYAAFMGNPFTMKAKVDFVKARSVMMQNRQRTFDRDVNDQMRRLTKNGPVDNVMRSFFIMTGLMDMSVSVPSWLAAYEQGMQQNNGDEAKAAAHADSVVRMTQSAGGVKDLAAIQRGGETWRMFTMFYSYFSVLYNLQAARLGQTKSAADLPQLAASAFFLWFAPAILGELLAGRGPDDDDDEDYLTWGAKEIAKYPFQTIVIVRDIVNAVVGDYGYGGSPALDAFEMTSSAIKSVASGDFDKSTAKATVLAVSYWAALPGRQAWITGSYLYDLATGEESGFSFRDLLFARKQQ